jgi:uncharacterized protein YciU (UPF0263 family)
MSGNKTLKTTGQLRDFLANMMLGVKNGDLELDRARNITKLAAQINESFYAEIKVAKVRAEAGELMPVFGEMSVGSADQ